jgi:hypothetical protein
LFAPDDQQISSTSVAANATRRNINKLLVTNLFAVLRR